MQLAEYHAAIRIRYLNTPCPGISRRKSRSGVAYRSAEGKKITDTETLLRIRKLAIPPAWREVWISPDANTHLQATGIDAKGRKQYRYHAEWNKKRNEKKFSKLAGFGRALPALRAELKSRLNQKGISRQKVVALVVQLMLKSYIRIGNTSYERQNGSYGLTTLKDEHVDIHGDSIRFVFVGKKGIAQDIELHDKRLARMVKSCRDIPGQELFQYYDGEGNRHGIDSGDVNHFLHEVCGNGYSAKDFRTWAGTLHAFKALAKLPVPHSEKEFRHVAAEVAKSVSKRLGNTATVCRKYYIHPVLMESFQKGLLQEFLQKHPIEKDKTNQPEEELLIGFLENCLP